MSILGIPSRSDERVSASLALLGDVEPFAMNGLVLEDQSTLLYEPVERRPTHPRVHWRLSCRKA